MVYPHCYRTEHSETMTTNATYGDYYAKEHSKKINIQPSLLPILQFCDSNRSQFIDDLTEAIAIESVSGSRKHTKDVLKMVKFTENWLNKLGVKYECFNIGYHELEGENVRLPPVILGSIGKDPTKKTLCVYSYLDVPLPSPAKWKTDPFVVTESERRLYGNGVATGKGTLICWFHVLQAFQIAKLPLPINLKFIIQSMHNCDSEGLDDFLITKKLDFLFDIDYVVVCDSEWIGEKYPCLVYGSVGLIHMRVTVEKKENPKEDMKKIFESIVNDDEEVLIPGFSDYVLQITPDEEMLYEDIEDFDTEEVRQSLPPYKQGWDKVKLLMHFWRLPSIFVDKIQECTCEKKDFMKVKMDFVIKIVPRQIVDRVINLTTKTIKNACEEHKLHSKVDIEVLSTSRPWLEDSRSINYEAARRATIQIYKEDPNMIRDDRDFKILNILSRILEKNILLLPRGNKNINAAKENENISFRNFYEGTKLLGAYLFQLGDLSSEKHKTNAKT